LSILAVSLLAASAYAKPKNITGAPSAVATGAASAKPAPKPAASSAKPPPLPAPAAAPTAAPVKKPAPTKPAITPNPQIQKSVAGGPTSTEVANGAESAELKAMREAEIDLFAGAAPALGNAWPSDLPSPPKGPLGAGGLPPAPSDASPPPSAVGGKSLSWLAGLKMPDIPVRWDARVVKYLEFFKDDPRGRRIFTVWWKRSGRYRELIGEQLRSRGLPEDLAWVAMAESGFDPTIKSPAGASGLWQFMPDSAKVYGLSVDRWADLRHSPLRSTEAAATFLSDLKKRFGTWELALAAYNMGYGGALSVVKKFNSNDYWELSKFENALPWETTHYVPKIIAIAIVARNPQTFGYDAVIQESSLKGEPVDVPAGTELKAIASAGGCTVKELESLNPELKAGRTPPAIESKDKTEDPQYTILVPVGKAAPIKDASSKFAPKGNSLEKYVVRFGETLDQIANARKTTKAKLVELNGIAKDESVRSGTTLLVPVLPTGTAGASSPYASPLAEKDKPTVLAHGVTFAYPDRTRHFYKVIVGDTPREIAEAFGVTIDDLKTWNAIEPTARLQEGMTLQIFVPKGADLSRVVAMKEGEVKLLSVGSDEFYAVEEAMKGRKRTTVLATGGETLEAVGKKHGLSAASMEKINRRPRSDVLKAGEAVIVYVAIAKGAAPEKSDKPAPAAPTEADLPAVASDESKAAAKKPD